MYQVANINGGVNPKKVAARAWYNVESGGSYPSPKEIHFLQYCPVANLINILSS